MWPRDAYVGQRVVAVVTAHDQILDVKVTKGTIYTIGEIAVHFKFHVYFGITELSGFRIHHSLFRPVDESRLDVFREILRHAKDKNLDRANA